MTDAEIITDADYADDLALLLNAPAQAESLLKCLARVASGMGLHVNASKTEFMHFKREGAVVTLSGTTLGLGDNYPILRQQYLIC